MVDHFCSILKEKKLVLEKKKRRRRRRRGDQQVSVKDQRGLSSGVIPIKVCEFLVWVDPFPHTPSSFLWFDKGWDLLLKLLELLKLLVVVVEIIVGIVVDCDVRFLLIWDLFPVVFLSWIYGILRVLMILSDLGKKPFDFRWNKVRKRENEHAKISGLGTWRDAPARAPQTHLWSLGAGAPRHPWRQGHLSHLVVVGCLVWVHLKCAFTPFRF